MSRRRVFCLSEIWKARHMWFGRALTVWPQLQSLILTHVLFPKSVLLSSESLSFQGKEGRVDNHQGLLWVYCCWLMQMFFMKVFGSFLKGKQSQSCCIQCSLCVASRFHNTGLPSYSGAESHVPLLTLYDNKEFFNYCPCHSSEEMEVQGYMKS